MENQTLPCTTCGKKAGWLQVTSAFSYKPNGTELTRKPKRALNYICRRRYCAYCGDDITARVSEVKP